MWPEHPMLVPGGAERATGGVVVHAGHGRTWFGPAGDQSHQADEAIRRVARCGLSLAEADGAIEVRLSG